MVAHEVRLGGDDGYLSNVNGWRGNYESGKIFGDYEYIDSHDDGCFTIRHSGTYFYRVKSDKESDVEFILHGIDEPAFESHLTYEFYVNGINVKIGDLPISDEEKMVLYLRYGRDHKILNGFYTYMK